MGCHTVDDFPNSIRSPWVVAVKSEDVEHDFDLRFKGQLGEGGGAGLKLYLAEDAKSVIVVEL